MEGEQTEQETKGKESKGSKGTGRRTGKRANHEKNHQEIIEPIDLMITEKENLKRQEKVEMEDVVHANPKEQLKV